MKNNNLLSKCCEGPPGPPGPPGPADLSSYVVSQTGVIVTTSPIEILAAGMTLTPPAGTYLVLFTSAVKNSNLGGSKLVELSIFSGGVKNAPSIVNSDNKTIVPFCCVGIVTVDGAQAIEGRWRLTLPPPPFTVITMQDTRTLTAIRIA
jgi:hypothetical protein